MPMINIFMRLRRKLTTIFWQLAIPPTLKSLGVELGEEVILYGWPIVSKASNSTIRVGHRVVVCSDPRFTALGVRQPCVIRTLNPGASIVIGNDTGMSGVTICSATSVTIGDGCLFGAGACIVDTDFHSIGLESRRYHSDINSINTAPVKIGNNVFIGMNAMILKGVTIGDHAVIGAGAVVSRSVPVGAIYAGNPARAIGLAGE